MLRRRKLSTYEDREQQEDRNSPKTRPLLACRNEDTTAVVFADHRCEF
jgi:hypothetical protein